MEPDDHPTRSAELDDRRDGRDETRNERADRNWEELLQELRVMQTGTQILTGFLLAVAFTPRFEDMDEFQRDVYVVLVGLAAVATILALAPVGMHRALFGRRRKPELVRVAARIVKIDLVTARLDAVVGTIRDVHDAVDEEDPTSADILHAVLESLEQFAWMVSAENRTPAGR